jgi:hypothetical protein
MRSRRVIPHRSRRFFFECFFDFTDSLIGVPPAGGHVNLPNFIILNKLAANFEKFFPDKWFSAGKIQIVNLPQRIGKRKYFVFGQVIPAV